VVTTRPLQDVLFHPTREAPALAVSMNDSRVSAEIRGVIDEITVRVGDTVRPGDLLAGIDCTDYEIALAEAEANLNSQEARKTFAESQLGNAQSLAKSNNISSEELRRRQSNAVAARADTERSRATLKSAERARDKCAVRSPTEAVVVERFGNLGDYVTEGTPLFRLIDSRNIEVSAQVQDQDVASLTGSTDIRFVAREAGYGVDIRQVVPLIDQRSGSQEVRLVFQDDRAVPGTPGRLVWQIPVPHVPTDFLVRRGASIGIFLVDDGKARFVELPGAEDGLPAPLVDPDDGEIVEDGRFTIRDGDPVSVAGPR
jgi:RND family efflux transporter MFP subunit